MARPLTFKELCEIDRIPFKENLKDYSNRALMEIFERATSVNPMVLAVLCAEYCRRSQRRSRKKDEQKLKYLKAKIRKDDKEEDYFSL